MPRPKSLAFARIRAEVIRLVALIPEGKFTTYGSIAVHMNVVARHVAFVMSRLTEEEAARLPWHRVVGADARVSQKMEAALAEAPSAQLQIGDSMRGWIGITLRVALLRFFGMAPSTLSKGVKISNAASASEADDQLNFFKAFRISLRLAGHPITSTPGNLQDYSDGDFVPTAESVKPR